MNNYRILKSPPIAPQRIVLVGIEGEVPEEKASAAQQEQQRLIHEAETYVEQAKIRLAEAEREAAKILAQAREQAEEILRKAEDERRRLLERTQDESEAHRREMQRLGLEQGRKEGYEQGAKKGYQDGYAQGRQVGIQEGRALLDQALQEARKLGEQIASQRKNTYLDMEAQLVELAFAIASKIIHASVRQGEAIRNVVRDVLQSVAKGEKLRFHVHPEDMPHLLAEKESLFQDWPVEIVEDPDICPGGCLVIAENGHIDARIDKQLQRIGEILKLD